MQKQGKKITYIDSKIDEILKKSFSIQKKYKSKLEKVDKIYEESAKNLVHYLALRSFNLEELQDMLKNIGLSGFVQSEAHVMGTLLSLKRIINCLKKSTEKINFKNVISVSQSRKIIDKNTKMIFGAKPLKRRTRIMVTIPGEAADNYSFIYNLLQNGMNSARINCAHDNEVIWEKIINNVKKASSSLNKKCTIMMDISGPKIRTGPINAGPKVIHIKPQKNSLGNITAPAKIWIAPQGVKPPDNSADFIIPVQENFLMKIRRGTILNFVDSRNKKGTIFVINKQGAGKWGISRDSSYLTTGTKLIIENYDNEESETGVICDLESAEEYILLKPGETLILHADARPGEPAILDSNGEITELAHISCTYPAIFKYAKAGEHIFFDDGKIEGVIESANDKTINIKIVNAKEKGSKLRSDRGINFPDTNYRTFAFSEKDKQDIEFISKHADVINFSFVNNTSDVENLIKYLKKIHSKLGIIIKVETENSFRNLPDILLAAMKTYPVGVMLARGDLAIETGWKNFATIQEEIMRVCSAAHIPVVWATQVLEQLAKKGTPTRAEITDAAIAHRAECVMLNKGPYIHKAVKMLDKILIRMEKFQYRRDTILPVIHGADKLKLSHKQYNV